VKPYQKTFVNSSKKAVAQGSKLLQLLYQRLANPKSLEKEKAKEAEKLGFKL